MITKFDKILNDEQLQILLDMAMDIPKDREKDEDERKQKNTVFDADTWPGSFGVNEMDRAFIKETLWKAHHNVSEPTVTKVTCGEFNPIFNSVARYDEGDFYDWHLDLLTTGYGSRVDIAFTAFLNDPSEYEGGELEIKHDYGVSSFKESAGTIVFYPTACLHRVAPITSGSRFVSLGLISCLVSSPQDRYILSEMIDCISKLNDVSEVSPDPFIVKRIDDVNHRLHAVQMKLFREYSNR
jgi:predicted 2-oxoglutarate/Fe(II)-dependent dioxygenase YbiX